MRAKYLGQKQPKEPTEISELLGSIIEKAAVGIDVRHGQLVTDWDAFAPKDWVTFGRPVGVRDLTLLVEVEDGSAATLLKYQMGDLLGVIRERFGHDLVTAVRVKVSHRPTPS
jgi:predicted nucleic acid-binding Zn ribbon protein